MSRTRKSAVRLFVWLFAGTVAFAQGGATGAIGGVVQDASGAVIANAKVSVANEATGEALRQVATDVSGLFTATLLPAGVYTVEVSATGFPTTKFPGIVVRITETTRMTAVVKVSSVKQVVEVQSQVEQVNTSDATTGQSLGQEAQSIGLPVERFPVTQEKTLINAIFGLMKYDILYLGFTAPQPAKRQRKVVPKQPTRKLPSSSKTGPSAVAS